MELGRSTGFLVNRLAHAMAGELDARLRPHGVTPSQWAVLALLWRKEGMTQAEIQRRLGVEGATVTGLLQRMARLGLVRRERDAADRRIRRVYLSDRARALEPVLVPEAEAVNARAMAGFSPDERSLFLRLLTRALANFE